MHRVRVIVCVLVLTAIVVASAAALPVAGRYPSGKTALNAPNEFERELLRLINADRRRHGMRPLEWEPRLSAVAREHSEDMAEYNYFDYVSPRLGTFVYRQHRAGSSAANARYAIFRSNTMETILEQLTRNGRPMHLSPVTHAGLGIVRQGLRQGYTVTLIFSEMHVRMEPFPTQPILNKTYRLRGNVDEGYRDAKLIVTLPGGDVVERDLELSPNGQFDALVPFKDGRGRYVVELTAVGKMGPVVLNIMHCYAGVPYPPTDTDAANDRIVTDLRRAEREMLVMINQARRKAGLYPVKWDDDLAAIARSHSADMVRNDFFFHVSPTTGDLEARMKRAGLTARGFTENLANNRTLRGAHDGLMDSPGHRKNILDPEADRVGIGIVRQGEDAIMVTQNFARDFEDYDPRTLVRQFFEEVNRRRTKDGHPRLQISSKLTEIARKNSEDMAKRNKTAYDHARKLLKAARLPYAIQIGVIKSSEPPKPEQIPQTLEKKYRRIGIAIEQHELSTGERALWTTVLLAEE